MGVDAYKKVKEEFLSMAKLNAWFEQKMKENMTDVAAKNVRKMSALQEELRVSNAMQQAILAMLNRLTSTAHLLMPAYPIH